MTIPPDRNRILLEMAENFKTLVGSERPTADVDFHVIHKAYKQLVKSLKQDCDLSGTALLAEDKWGIALLMTIAEVHSGVARINHEFPNHYGEFKNMLTGFAYSLGYRAGYHAALNDTEQKLVRKGRQAK